jgi:drug/metabolite transporter (DMT)-like permease
VSLGLALAGAVLIIGPIGEGRSSTLGIVLAVAAALIYSGYILVATRITRGMDPVWSSACITLSTAIGFGLIVVVRGAAWPASPVGWAAVVAIALVSTVVAILCFMAGLARIGPTDASTLSTLEPAVTVLLALVVLGESLGIVQLLGGVLVLAAALVVARSDPPKVPAPRAV